MIELKISVDDAAELPAAVANLAATLAKGGDQTTAPSEVKEAKEKLADSADKPKKKDKPVKADKTEDDPKEETKSEKLPEEKAADSNIDYKVIQSKVVALAGKKGRDAVVAILAEFDADHASKVDEADWSKLVARLDEEAGK